jgi:hypothetical protein
MGELSAPERTTADPFIKPGNDGTVVSWSCIMLDEGVRM